MRRIKIVYLAGGMKSDWQDKVIEALSNKSIVFHDPRTHGLKEPSEYTKWDLNHIKKSDTVFAYLELDNPGGEGLNLEIGYAKALGKRIIFINEKTSRYLGMACECADVLFTTLNEGIEYLKSG